MESGPPSHVRPVRWRSWLNSGSSATPVHRRSQHPQPNRLDVVRCNYQYELCFWYTKPLLFAWPPNNLSPTPNRFSLSFLSHWLWFNRRVNRRACGKHWGIHELHWLAYCHGLCLNFPNYRPMQQPTAPDINSCSPSLFSHRWAVYSQDYFFRSSYAGINTRSIRNWARWKPCLRRACVHIKRNIHWRLSRSWATGRGSHVTSRYPWLTRD